MHKLNPRTAALLSAFGWAVGYLLQRPGTGGAAAPYQ